MNIEILAKYDMKFYISPYWGKLSDSSHLVVNQFLYDNRTKHAIDQTIVTLYEALNSRARLNFSTDTVDVDADFLEARFYADFEMTNDIYKMPTKDLFDIVCLWKDFIEKN